MKALLVTHDKLQRYCNQSWWMQYLSNYQHSVRQAHQYGSPKQSPILCCKELPKMTQSITTWLQHWTLLLQHVLYPSSLHLQKQRSLRRYKFLTSAFELSECERATALFNLPGLGDSKPSELMYAMLALLRTHKPCFLFKHLFLQQLPEYVRDPFATAALNDYRALAQEADQIYLLGRHHPANIIQEVNATGYKSSKAPPPNTSKCMLVSSPI